jgi:predicted DsbA family dithiol-disulfide isomerase
MQVEIWSDVVCPWCYLGKRRFEQALESFEHRDQVEVSYRSFELDPTAPGGETAPTIDVLARKYGLSPDQAVAAQRQMQDRAAAEGLTFRMDGLTSGNTRDAHRLLQLAGDTGLQAEFAERLHRAYFTEQTSVFDHAALAELADSVGLDAGAVQRVLTSGEYGDAVDADEAMAHSLGVTGVPFFVFDRRYGVSGAQPAKTLTQVLERAWAESSASTASAESD